MAPTAALARFFVSASAFEYAQEVLGPLRRGNSCHDDRVNVMWPCPYLLCVCVHTYAGRSDVRPKYGKALEIMRYLWGVRGNVMLVSRVFLCAEWLARARVLYEACGVDPQAV